MHLNPPGARVALAGAMLVALLAAPRGAEASPLVEPRGTVLGLFTTELAYLNTLLSTAAGATAMTALIENGLISRTGARPPRIWRVLGYAVGGASVVLGALNIGTSQGDGAMITAGCGLVAVGMLDLGLVMWGSRQLEVARVAAPPRVVFGPRILTDAAGKPAYGVGVSLLNW